MATSLRNIAFDGATGRIRFGSVAVPCLKVTVPKEEVKKEKLAYIGEQIKTVRTLGQLEVGTCEVEMTTAIYAGVILPRLQSHATNLVEFPVTLLERHPQIASPYSIILDRCSIIGTNESKENSEKAQIIKLTLDVIQVYRRGADGQWKTLAWKPTLGASAAAVALFQS